MRLRDGTFLQGSEPIKAPPRSTALATTASQESGESEAPDQASEVPSSRWAAHFAKLGPGPVSTVQVECPRFYLRSFATPLKRTPLCNRFIFPMALTGLVSSFGDGGTRSSQRARVWMHQLPQWGTLTSIVCDFKTLTIFD